MEILKKEFLKKNRISYDLNNVNICTKLLEYLILKSYNVVANDSWCKFENKKKD